MTRTVRWIPSAALALAACAATVSGAHAQTSLTVGTGAGLSIPIGDLADTQGLGWNAQGNIGVQNPGWPIALRFDVMYHALSGEDVVEGSGLEFADLQVIAGVANAELYISRAANGGGFFLVGGAGIYNLDAEGDGEDGDSSTDFGLLGGAGYKIAMTNLFLSIEGKFHNIFGEGIDAQLIPINIVAEIPLGGR